MANYTPKTNANEGTAFNMGIATLMGINNILEDLSKLASVYHADLVNNQLSRVTMVKALYLRSVPLLGDDVETFRKRIEVLRGISVDTNKLSASKGVTKVFSYALEQELDNLIIDIQLALQSKHVFMPSKADPKYGWKQ
jgi:hypothetical protein